MMTADKLSELIRLATAESPMTRVALDDLADPARLRRVLQVEYDKHVRAHESIGGLVDRIRGVTGMADARAQRIARTEKTKGSNGGRFAQLANDYLKQYQAAVKAHRKRPERPLIEWIDPRTAKEPRHHHVAMTGTTVRLGDRFPNGLRFPGDPDAPVEEVANCHCYIRRKAQRAAGSPDEAAQPRPRSDQQPANIKVAEYTIRLDGSDVEVPKPQPAPRRVVVPVVKVNTAEDVEIDEDEEIGAYVPPVPVRMTGRRIRRSGSKETVTGVVLSMSVLGNHAEISLQTIPDGWVLAVSVSAVLLKALRISVGQTVAVSGRMTAPGRMDAIAISNGR